VCVPPRGVCGVVWRICKCGPHTVGPHKKGWAAVRCGRRACSVVSPAAARAAAEGGALVPFFFFAKVVYIENKNHSFA
jgi:hypothetical protein